MTKRSLDMHKEDSIISPANGINNWHLKEPPEVKKSAFQVKICFVMVITLQDHFYKRHA